MRKMIETLRSSAGELRKTNTIALAGLLIAFSVVLALLKIPISLINQISFASLPIAAGGMLFGPVVGALIGVAADLLGYVARPTGPFFPGFTLNALLVGALYGFLLYRKKPTLPRVALLSLLTTLLINMLLTPLWLQMMFGKAFLVLVAARISKNIILYPITTALLYGLLNAVHRVSTSKKAF